MSEYQYYEFLAVDRPLTDAQRAEVRKLLSDSLTPRGVGQWLHARNRLLAGERPLDVLVDGRYGEVRDAAQAFVDGAYV